MNTTLLSLCGSFAAALRTLRIFTDGPMSQELVKGIPSPNFPSLKQIIVISG